MSLTFYNTLSNEKEKFTPRQQGKVKMYTCGPTVYDYAHIGNYRAYIFEDLLRRYLIYKGYEVIQVMNLTDVDDKTIKASQNQGISLNEYTKKYKEAFFNDLEALNIQRAEYYPSATDHVEDMLEMVQTLVEKGYGYQGKDGSYYYRISKFDDYGKLSGKNVDELQAGKRVKQDEYSKEEVCDFALWKAYEESDGDVFWNTPLGKGRPGWHIECSAMSTKYLGRHFDIHTGGVDNIFPHHENEIAQSEATYDEKFVDYWLHCAHLQVEGEKMSKSLGNFYTLREILDKGFNPLAIRYLLLSTHYRKELNFTFEGIEASKKSIERLYEFVDKLRRVDGSHSEIDVNKKIKETREQFEENLDDDLNISPAIGAIFSFVRDINKELSSEKLSEQDAKQIIDFFDEIDIVLGLNLTEKREKELPQKYEELIKEREQARKNNNYEKADEIRNKLKAAGIIIKDTPEGTVWKREE